MKILDEICHHIGQVIHMSNVGWIWSLVFSILADLRNLIHCIPEIGEGSTSLEHKPHQAGHICRSVSLCQEGQGHSAKLHDRAGICQCQTGTGVCFIFVFVAVFIQVSNLESQVMCIDEDIFGVKI